jgi:hypothetical protein
MNVRELSVGSYVQVNLGRYGLLTGMVGEVNSRQLGIFIIEKTLVPPSIRRFVVGKLHHFKLFRIEGILIDDFRLRHLGFLPADKSGWQLMYYFGDMILLYRYNKNRKIASFRFMSDFTKSYTRITCHFLHDLQTIMRFLTGGELEFEYTNTTNYEQ